MHFLNSIADASSFLPAPSPAPTFLHIPLITVRVSSDKTQQLHSDPQNPKTSSTIYSQSNTLPKPPITVIRAVEVLWTLLELFSSHITSQPASSVPRLFGQKRQLSPRPSSICHDTTNERTGKDQQSVSCRLTLFCLVLTQSFKSQKGL